MPKQAKINVTNDSTAFNNSKKPINNNRHLKRTRKHEKINQNIDRVESTDGVIPENLLIPKPFTPLKKGFSITSIEDQPIPEIFKTKTRKMQQQMQVRGYSEASEDEIIEIERYLYKKNKSYLLSFEAASEQLTFEPAELTNTLFTSGQFIGAAVGGTFIDDRWTGLTRLYELPDYGVVKLDEDDYDSTEGGIQFTEELINEEINGYAAIYTVQVSSSDKALTKITWVTENREYSLSMVKNAAKNDELKQDFIDLAHAIH